MRDLRVTRSGHARVASHRGSGVWSLATLALCAAALLHDCIAIKRSRNSPRRAPPAPRLPTGAVAYISFPGCTSWEPERRAVTDLPPARGACMSEVTLLCCLRIGVEQPALVWRRDHVGGRGRCGCRLCGSGDARVCVRVRRLLEVLLLVGAGDSGAGEGKGRRGRFVDACGIPFRSVALRCGD